MDRGESQLGGEFESSDEEGISEPEVRVFLYDASLYMSTFNNRRGTDSCYLLLKLMFVRDEKKKKKTSVLFLFRFPAKPPEPGKKQNVSSTPPVRWL